MIYRVSEGSFDCDALSILYSATTNSISVIASLTVSNLSACVGFVMDGTGNVGNTPKKNKEGSCNLGTIG